MKKSFQSNGEVTAGPFFCYKGTKLVQRKSYEYLLNSGIPRNFNELNILLTLKGPP